MNYNEMRMQLSKVVREKNLSVTPQVMKVAAKTLLGEFSANEKTRAKRASAARKTDNTANDVWTSQQSTLETLVGSYK